MRANAATADEPRRHTTIAAATVRAAAIGGSTMKINVTMETSPAELREFLGLPEVQSLQAEMIEKVREQMKAGAEGFDPAGMMRPFITPDLQGMEAMQRAFWNGVSAVATAAGGPERKG